MKPRTEPEAGHIATPSFWLSRKRKRDRSQPPQKQFPLLFDGAESSAARDLRQRTFETLWQEQELTINEVLATFNEKITTELSTFVCSPRPENDPMDSRISSGIILAGNNVAGHHRLFSQIQEELKTVMNGPVIVLTAADVSTVQNLQKKIVAGSLNIDAVDDDDEGATSKSPRLAGRLPYDLEIIEELCASQEPDFRIVIAFEDTEAFQSSIISQFILHNRSRLARLPIILLFGVASTLDQFQQSLPTAVILSLQAQIFEVRQNDECLRIIVETVLMGSSPRLRLGPRVLSFLVEKYKYWNQSVENFISGIKYAYMCHFYANPLSLLLAFPDIDDESMDNMLTHTHLNAIRSLPSMRRYIEEKLNAEDTIEVETLLQDDQYLKGLLRQYVRDVHERAGELKAAVRVLAKLQERSQKSKRNLVDLYLDVLTGELTPQSPFVRELLQLQRKLSASSLLTFLTETADLVITTDEEIPRPFRYFAEEMEDLMANKARLSTADGGLTSAYEIESRTGNRATKVSQKLRQEKDRDSMTSLDKSFTEVVARINETLIHLFRALAAPSDLPLYEVFYFNSVKTLEDVITLVFAAQPREAHKTAFRNPAHWLSCTCCKKENDYDIILASQPTTSILHEQYLETTTAMINMYDWFQSYSEIKSVEADGDEDGDAEGSNGLSEEQLLAGFMASLDELVWMGYIKRTQRKTDHVEKLVGG